ncbi:MAG: hypothetical protein GX345_09095 [Clostridiales bacterium]|nr:hypothetical protein [Clostridiales bacterium]
MAKVKNADWITGKKERISYYSYFLGQNAIYTMVSTFLTTYLLFQGLDPAKSGLVMLAVKVWDAVNNTVFGVVFDSVRFKSGKKFLPWIKVSTFLIPVTTVLIYSIPRGLDETMKLAWFAVAYILWDTAYTLCDVPIYGIVTAMTQRIDERTSLLSFKSIWAGVGSGIAMILGTVLVGEKVGLNFGLAAVIVALIAFATMLPVNFNVKERFKSESEEEFTVKRMFTYLFGNKYLLIYYWGFLVQGSLAVGPPLVLLVSYYMFKNSQFSLIILALSVLPMLFAALFVPKLLKRIDKMRLYLICNAAVIVISVIIWLVGYKSMVTFALLSALRSAPAAIVGVTMFMFTPDCAEYGIFETGIDAKGITFAIQTFMAKLTGAISGSLGLILLKLYDWTPVKAESFEDLQRLAISQSDRAMGGLWFVYNAVPIIGMVAAFIIWLFYKLRDKDVQIMADANCGKISRDEALILLNRK